MPMLDLPAPLQGEVAGWLLAREVALLCATCRAIGATLTKLEGLWRHRLRTEWADVSTVTSRGTLLATWLAHEARAARWRSGHEAQCHRTLFTTHSEGSEGHSLGIWHNLLLVGDRDSRITVFSLPTLRKLARWRVGSSQVTHLWVQESGALLVCSNQLLSLWEARDALTSPENAVPSRRRCFCCRAWGWLRIHAALLRDETNSVLALFSELPTVAEWSVASGSLLRQISATPPSPSACYLSEWNGADFVLHYCEHTTRRTFPVALSLPAATAASAFVATARSEPGWRLFSLGLVTEFLPSCEPSTAAGSSLGRVTHARPRPLEQQDACALGYQVRKLAFSAYRAARAYTAAVSSRYFAALFWDEHICVLDFGHKFAPYF